MDATGEGGGCVAGWLAATADPARVAEAEANLAAAARRVPGFLRGLLELVVRLGDPSLDPVAVASSAERGRGGCVEMRVCEWSCLVDA